MSGEVAFYLDGWYTDHAFMSADWAFEGMVEYYRSLPGVTHAAPVQNLYGAWGVLYLSSVEHHETHAAASWAQYVWGEHMVGPKP